MRRLITMLVGVFVLLAAGFTSQTAAAWDMGNLYLYGDNGPFTGWNNKTNENLKLTKNPDNGNNAYIKGITFRETVYFRISEGGSTDLQPTNNLTGKNCIDVLKKDIEFGQGSDNCWQLSAGTYDIFVTQGSPNKVRIEKKEEISAKDFWLYKQPTKGKDSWSKVGKFTTTDGTNYTLEESNLTKVSGTNYLILDADKGDTGKTWDDLGSNKWGPSVYSNITNATISGATNSNPNVYYTDFTGNPKDGKVTFKLVYSGSSITYFRADVTFVQPAFDKTLKVLTNGNGSYNLTYDENAQEFTGSFTIPSGNDRWFRFQNSSNYFMPTENSNQDNVVSGNRREAKQVAAINNIWRPAQGAGDYKITAWYTDRSNSDGNLYFYITRVRTEISDLYLMDISLGNTVLMGKMEYNAANDRYELKYSNPSADLTGDNFKFFVTTDNTVDKGWGYYDGKRYTTTGEGDVTITKNATTGIGKNDSGAIKWNKGYSEAIEVVFYVNGDLNTFGVSVVEDKSPWYLVGDINNWAIKTASDNMTKWHFRVATPAEKSAEGVSGDNWYVLDVPRMHGQFQIHNGYWGQAKFGHIFDSGTNHDEKWGENNKPGEGYYSAYVPETSPAEANVAANRYSENDENPVGGGNEVTFLNLHLKHNYYKNAKIWFSSSEKKVFIKGEPEDLYIYYFNDAETSESTSGNTSLKYQGIDANPNSLNYFYDEKILNDGFQWVTLSDAEKAAEAFHELVTSCYRAQIAPGLEEAYKTSNGTHFFQFKLQNSKMINDQVPYTIAGKNFYFINLSDRPVGVLLNYQYMEMANDGTDTYPAQPEQITHVYYDGSKFTHSKVLDIKYRFIALDASGVPHYVKNDGTLTSGQDRDDADVLVRDLRRHLQHGVDGFTKPAAHPVYGESDHWNAVDGKARSVSSIVAKAESDWTAKIGKVAPANLNRYVEFEVKLQDPDSQDSDYDYYEHFSDFNYEKTADGKNQKLQSKPVVVSELGNNYKLNGSHLYAVARTHSVGTNVPTAVDKIGEDVDANAEVVYYNLQGLRVENPTNGIFIKVQGKKATKVRF